MASRESRTARNICGRYLLRRVMGVIGMLGMVLLGACQPGPQPTPTLPAEFVESPIPLPASPTPRPLLTPPPTPVFQPTLEPTRAPTLITPIVATYTPSATAWIATRIAVVGTPPAGRLQADSAERLISTPASGINALPIPDVVSVRDLPATPFNEGFEGPAIQQGAPEVNVPQGWTAWWRTGTVDCTIYRVLGTAGPCPVFDEPGLRYRRPEFTVIPASGPWLDPPRVLGGEGSAARFFCTYGVCVAGYLQRVQVVPGQQYTLSAWVQSWCTDDSNDHAHSQLDTEDARLNCELAVGLDPNAGLDPRSPDIVWAAGYAYDAFGYVSTPPVRATRDAMTLFLRGRSLWGLKHNDFHYDQVTFRAE